MSTKGYKQTEEHKRKIGIANAIALKDRPLDPEHRKNVIAYNKSKEGRENRRITSTGKKQSIETRQKRALKMKGHIVSISTRKLIGKANRGENNGMFGVMGKNNPNWKGGVNPYPREFNKELKFKIRTRDNFICCLCKRTEREEFEEFNRALCVNHIDFNKQNCKEENLNTLCLRCNVKICREREYWTNYFNQ